MSDIKDWPDRIYMDVRGNYPGNSTFICYKKNEEKDDIEYVRIDLVEKLKE